MKALRARAGAGFRLVVAAICFVCPASPAAAALEARLVPAPDGHLGAWLVAGPLTARAGRNPDP